MMKVNILSKVLVSKDAQLQQLILLLSKMKDVLSILLILIRMKKKIFTAIIGAGPHANNWARALKKNNDYDLAFVNSRNIKLGENFSKTIKSAYSNSSEFNTNGEFAVPLEKYLLSKYIFRYNVFNSRVEFKRISAGT